jgi:hypothetical protein
VKVARSSAGGVEALALKTKRKIKMDSGFRRNDERKMDSGFRRNDEQREMRWIPA